MFILLDESLLFLWVHFLCFILKWLQSWCYGHVLVGFFIYVLGALHELLQRVNVILNAGPHRATQCPWQAVQEDVRNE